VVISLIRTAGHHTSDYRLRQLVVEMVLARASLVPPPAEPVSVPDGLLAAVPAVRQSRTYSTEHR
jgi:hypothetical protein